MSGDRKSGMPAEVLTPAPTCHDIVIRGQPIASCIAAQTHHNHDLLRMPISYVFGDRFHGSILESLWWYAFVDGRRLLLSHLESFLSALGI